MKRILNKLNGSTANAIITGAVILGISHLGYAYIISKNKYTVPVNPFLGRMIDQTDFVFGNKKSDVVVIEYSDPECPYCVQFSETAKKIRDTYKDRVSFVYRSFPLTQIHTHAFDEARAMACAGKVGGDENYYKYIDNFFDYKLTNKTTSLAPTGKEDLAKELGLDMTKFNSCMTNNDTKQLVEDSVKDGVNAGVTGTPTTFVLIKDDKNYNLISTIEGARQESFVKSAIEQALSR